MKSNRAIISFNEYFKVNEADQNIQAEIKNLNTQLEGVRNTYNSAAEQFRANKITAEQLMISYKAFLDKDAEVKMATLKSKIDTAGETIKQATDAAANSETGAKPGEMQQQAPPK